MTKARQLPTESPLNAASERPGEFTAGPAPGSVLPECPVTIVENAHAREAHLTDLVGARFTALYFTDDGTVPAQLADMEATLAHQKVPFTL